MKVKVIESKAKEEIPFPKLMESDIGTIVLFYKEREGVLLKTVPESFKEVGEYHEEWAMDIFTDFEGKLELTNK
jgi:hypothetical protein